MFLFFFRYWTASSLWPRAWEARSAMWEKVGDSRMFTGGRRLGAFWTGNVDGVCLPCGEGGGRRVWVPRYGGGACCAASSLWHRSHACVPL